MTERLSDHQVWALAEFDRNGPGKDGRVLMEERGHGAFTLHSFLRRGFTDYVEGIGIDLTDKGRAALASVTDLGLLEIPNPRRKPIEWEKFTFLPCVGCEEGTAGRCHLCKKPLCGTHNCTNFLHGLVLCLDCHHEYMEDDLPPGVSWDEERGAYVDEAGMTR